MSGDIGIGRLIEGEQGRDAIHVAVVPVVAGEKLEPGAWVGIKNGKATEDATPIGIVDPFLRGKVKPGQKFYLFLPPCSITSLRHVWTHPALGDEAEPGPPTAQPALTDKQFSEAWLRRYAARVNCSLGAEDAYETLLSDLRSGELTYHGTDMHSMGELIDADELRRHASIVLGREIDWGAFEYFSCSC